MRPQRRESKRLSSPYPPPLSRPPSRSPSLSGAYGRPNARRDAVDAGQEVALGGALLVALRPLKLRLVELVCDNSMCSLLSMSRQRILFAESFPARSQNCSLAVKSKPNKLFAHGPTSRPSGVDIIIHRDRRQGNREESAFGVPVFFRVSRKSHSEQVNAR